MNNYDNDQERIKALFECPVVQAQVDAFAKLNLGADILGKMSQPLKDAIDSAQRSIPNVSKFDVPAQNYQLGVEELKKLNPSLDLLQHMESTLRAPLLEEKRHRLIDEMAAAQKMYEHLPQGQPIIELIDKFKESTSYITEILSSNKDPLQQLEAFRPILPTIASAMNSPIGDLIPTDSLNAIFNIVTATTDSLADSIIELKKLNFLQFERITEKNIRTLFDSNLINHISYAIPQGAREPQVFIQDKEGHSYPLDTYKDRISLQRFLPELEATRILDFTYHLGSFPLLGLHHDVGRILFDELERTWENYVEEIPKGTTFFRTRNNDSDCPILPQNMFEPPYGVPDIGRFNWHGINHLYLTDSLKTSKAELNYNQNKKKGITSIKANNKELLRIFVLDRNMGSTFSHCLLEDPGKDNNHHTYFLPNFISQCLCWLIAHKDIKLDGIKYQSTKTSKESYCFVLFNKHDDDFRDVTTIV